MEFKFLPVVAIFIMNIATAVTENHDDCFKYDADLPNGKKKIDPYRECGITNSKQMNCKNVKCFMKAFQAVNEDGNINEKTVHDCINDYAYPEYQEQLHSLVDKLFKPPEKFYKNYPKGVIKICPKDQLFGNP